MKTFPLRRPGRDERGVALIAAFFLSLAIAGLSFGLLTYGMAASQSLRRGEDSFHALEIAETGVARAELEITSELDPDGDGIGTVSGSYDSGTYTVTATQDTVLTKNWHVVAKATKRMSNRTIEIGMKRIPGGAYIEGMFSHQELVVNGSNTTDAYDSRLGTYASQATNVDTYGSYALVGGNLGSNSSFIELHGSDIIVRGDAVPGPGHSVDEAGNPVVVGDTAPRKYERDLQPTPLSEFQAAATTNDNGNWTAAGGNLTYDSSTMALSYKAGGVMTMPGGTYFFSTFSLSGNSAVVFTGPAKIYVTGSLDMTGGTFMNNGVPSDLQILAHPYAVPTGFTPTTTSVKVNGGSGSAFVMYGPSATLDVGGDGDIFGAAVASEINIGGHCRYHYDKALDDFALGTARIERLYWREGSPPRR